MKNNTFELKPEHVALLTSGRVYVGWQYCEYGAPEINPKRPYGNSDVEGDVAEILGWIPEDDDDGYPILSEKQQEAAWKIHRETDQALEVILNAKSFEPGLYKTSNPYSNDWHRA